MSDDGTKRAIWARYVEEIAGSHPQAISKLIKARFGYGPSQPSIGRWLRAEHLPKPVEAAVLARAYDANVLAAFVAAGFVTIDEADRGLSASDLDLLDRAGVLGAHDVDPSRA